MALPYDLSGSYEVPEDVLADIRAYAATDEELAALGTDEELNSYVFD